VTVTTRFKVFRIFSDDIIENLPPILCQWNHFENRLFDEVGLTFYLTKITLLAITSLYITKYHKLFCFSLCRNVLLSNCIMMSL